MDDDWCQVNPQKKKKFDVESKKQNSLATQNILAMHYENLKQTPPPPKKKTKVLAETNTNTKVKEVSPEKKEGNTKIPFEKRQKLIQLREKKGLTRNGLARLVQQSNSIIENLENAKGLYDPNLYNKIIQQLEKLPDKLEKEVD